MGEPLCLLNIAFSGAPLWAHPLQGFVGRQRASRFPMSWTLACALRRHVDSSQRHGTKSAKAFLAVALIHNFHICNRHCLPDLYCLGLRDDGLSVSGGQKVNVEIDRNCDASCGQRGRDRPTGPLPLRERGVTLHTADLHTVLNVEVFPSLFLSVEVLGMETPSPLCLFRLEFHDGHSFAVLRDKALV